MLSAHAAFDGDSVSAILSEVLKSEPDWRRLPTETPEGIRRLLRRSLQKDRTLRLHDIADARIEIDDALVTPRGESAAVSGASRGRERITWLSAMGLITLVATTFVCTGVSSGSAWCRDARRHHHTADDRSGIAGDFARRAEGGVRGHLESTITIVVAVARFRARTTIGRNRSGDTSVLVA